MNYCKSADSLAVCGDHDLHEEGHYKLSLL